MLRSLNIFRISEELWKKSWILTEFSRNSDVQKFEWCGRSPIEPFNPEARLSAPPVEHRDELAFAPAQALPPGELNPSFESLPNFLRLSLKILRKFKNIAVRLLGL